MSLVPEITLAKLQSMSADEIRELPSVELSDEDGYFGTLIVPSREGGNSIYDEIKTKAEYLGVQGNIVVPVNKIASLGETDNPLKCDCGFIAKSRIGLISHMRTHKVAV